MNLLQQYQVWIGLGFVIVVFAFLILAFFKAPNMTASQRDILKIISSLGAGFAGALIAGEALFKLQGEIGAGTVFVSGTSGVALFLVVWFFFPKLVSPSPPAPTPPPERFIANIPAGWTFRQTVDTFVQKDNAVPSYEGFKPEELSAPLRQWTVNTADIADAIRKLRSITVNDNAIRKYEVIVSDSAYLIRIT
jgi:hypothetical protein